MSDFAAYHHELKQALSPYKGQELKTSAIKDIFSGSYPHLNADWVQPSDHCENHTCNGSCECSGTDWAIFFRESYGIYRVL